MFSNRFDFDLMNNTKTKKRTTIKDVALEADVTIVAEYTSQEADENKIIEAMM